MDTKIPNIVDCGNDADVYMRVRMFLDDCTNYPSEEADKVLEAFSIVERAIKLIKESKLHGQL